MINTEHYITGLTEAILAHVGTETRNRPLSETDLLLITMQVPKIRLHGFARFRPHPLQLLFHDFKDTMRVVRRLLPAREPSLIADESIYPWLTPPELGYWKNEVRSTLSFQALKLHALCADANALIQNTTIHSAPVCCAPREYVDFFSEKRRTEFGPLEFVEVQSLTA